MVQISLNEKVPIKGEKALAEEVILSEFSYIRLIKPDSKLAVQVNDEMLDLLGNKGRMEIMFRIDCHLLTDSFSGDSAFFPGEEFNKQICNEDDLKKLNLHLNARYAHMMDHLSVCGVKVIV